MRSWLDLAFTKYSSDVCIFPYIDPMGNSYHLVIKFALASLLISMTPIQLVKQSWKLNAKIAPAMTYIHLHFPT